MNPTTVMFLAFLICGLAFAVLALAALWYHDRTHQRRD